MAVLKCKMCGGDLILTEGSCIAECEYCGSLQTVPSADNEKKMNLFARANRLRAGSEFDKAAGVYESIVTDFPEEAEAYWGLILCKYGIEYVDDPGTGNKIPTCHRSSFDSLMDDPNFELVMEYADPIARKVYREEAKQIEELRKGIIEVSSKEEPYDIFICYKESDENGQRTLDSVLAQDIYDMLAENGYRVFFSRISLEDKLGVEYEPYIFAALNSAKIMLAVGTDYDYYNAVWVKNEWSRFLQLIAKGEKKTLIPCFKNIDAYDILKEFAKLQAQDLGKVGAMQDLLRGVSKILPKKAGIQNDVAPQAADQTEILLKRATMSLEDGEWAKADDLCEQVLNLNPENAHAYLDKLMTELRVKKPSDLARCGKLYTNNSNFQKAIRFGDTELRKELKDYADTNVFSLTPTPAGAFEFSAKDNGWSIKKLLDKNLTEVVIPLKYQEKRIIAIDNEAFRSCKNLVSISIPISVTSIGKEAFRFCDNLTNVMIPDSVTSIGEEAFDSCENLISVIISDNLTTIDKYMFSCCKNLASVTIPIGVTTIGENAFNGCENLTSVKISDSVTTIGEAAFIYCRNLTNITIPDSVTTIGKNAFSACKSLTSITIPNSVTTIGESAFSFCMSLASITIPDSVNTIGDRAFCGCEKLADKNGFVIFGGILHFYCGSSEFVTIPENVTTIGSEAFNGCKSLIGVTIPDSVTVIGNSAFNSCKSLASIMISDSVTVIGEAAFRGCADLARVTIPDSVTTIGEKAFLGCVKLADENGFVIVKDALYSYCGSSEFVTIPENVTAISSRAFTDNKSLVGITIPDSVTAIGSDAFNSCTSLTSVIIPARVTVIDEYAFYSCTSLTSVTIPDSVTVIGKAAFRDCTSLASVTIPDSVTVIDEYAFTGCMSLTSVTIPDSVTTINNYAFSDCTSLTSITIPDSVTTIGYCVFYSSNNLKTIICRGNYEKLKSVFKIKNTREEFIFASLERGLRRRRDC